MNDICDRCGRPVATEEDWAQLDPGEGEHLCWGGSQCREHEAPCTACLLTERAARKLGWSEAINCPAGLWLADELSVCRGTPNG